MASLEITQRRTAHRHPEGNSYTERFHRSLKEEELGLAEYLDLEGAWGSTGRYLREYKHDLPQRGLQVRTPREAHVGLESDVNNRALTVKF